MSWSSGNRRSGIHHRASVSDSSSDEDIAFAYKAHSNASYKNLPCQHSNCANRYSRNANYEENHDNSEEDLNKVANSSMQAGFSSHLNLCSKLPHSNCASSNIRVCTTCYSSSQMGTSIASNVSHNHSMNMSPTNSLSQNESNNHLVLSGNGELNGASALPSYEIIASDDVCPIANQYAQAIPVEKLEEVHNVSSTSSYGYLGLYHDDSKKFQKIKGNNNDCIRSNNLENGSSQRGDKKVPSESQLTSNNNQHNPPGVLYNWQATMTTVKERFAFLFNNEVLSDVHFRVGKGELSQRIPAHKFVLAVGSAVFDAMFNGNLSVRQEEIELPDVEPQAFLSLLRFLYSDDVQIGPETVMTVLYTAKKYAVPSLERHCVEFLKCNLASDNAFMLLTQARLFDEPQLAALCLDTIDKNTSDALNADGFTDIDHNTLCLVLGRDTLRIRESKLFHAVVRWSVAQCVKSALSVDGTNQRTILDRALSLIRFPLMTIEEFAQSPAQSNILTDREIVQLFLYFTVNPKPPINFLDTPRCCMTGKEQKVCRFPQIESRWGYSGTSDRIRFIVDRRIFVVGFGMYGSTHGPAEYEVTLQIIHTATQKVCASNDTSFMSDGSVHTFTVMFKEPVEVLPNTNYTAYAILKGPDSHYGTKGVRKIAVECPSGDRVTFQFTYAAGNNNGTSVEDGQIPEIIFYT